MPIPPYHTLPAFRSGSLALWVMSDQSKPVYFAEFDSAAALDRTGQHFDIPEGVRTLTPYSADSHGVWQGTEIEVPEPPPDLHEIRAQNALNAMSQWAEGDTREL